MFLEHLDSRRLFFIVLIVKLFIRVMTTESFFFNPLPMVFHLHGFCSAFHFQLFIYGYLLACSYRKLIVVTGGFLLLEYSIHFLYKTIPHMFYLLFCYLTGNAVLSAGSTITLQTLLSWAGDHNPSWENEGKN